MPHRVSPREAHALLTNDGYTYVDVRSVAEFEAGHPAGAFNVPWVFVEPTGRTPNADFAAVIEKTFPKDAKLVLGCQAGGRSLAALEHLEARGFTALVDQRAGWGGPRDAFGRVTEAGWQAEGLPVETGDGGERSYGALKSR